MSKEEEKHKMSEYRSSLSEMEGFANSNIWKDIKEFLQISLEQFERELLVKDEPVRLYRLQGTISEIKVLLELPELIIEDMKELMQEEKEEDEDEQE